MTFVSSTFHKVKITIFFYFIFKLYKIVLVLPNIKMNPPQVYMCSLLAFLFFWFNISFTFNEHFNPRNKEEDPFSAVARPGEERGNVPSLLEDTTLPSGSPSLRRKVNAAQGLKRLSHRLLGSWEVGSTLSHSPVAGRRLRALRVAI